MQQPQEAGLHRARQLGLPRILLLRHIAQQLVVAQPPVLQQRLRMPRMLSV